MPPNCFLIALALLATVLLIQGCAGSSANGAKADCQGLSDQTKPVTYVLTGGAGADLVLSTYVQTTVAPYGARLKGLMQRESTIT